MLAGRKLNPPRYLEWADQLETECVRIHQAYMPQATGVIIWQKEPEDHFQEMEVRLFVSQVKGFRHRLANPPPLPHDWTEQWDEKSGDLFSHDGKTSISDRVSCGAEVKAGSREVCGSAARGSPVRPTKAECGQSQTARQLGRNGQGPERRASARASLDEAQIRGKDCAD